MTSQPANPYVSQSAAAAARGLDVDPAHGLSPETVALRQKQFGANALEDPGGRTLLAMLLAQLSGTLTLVLIGAAVISAALQDWEDALAIAAIVVLNAVLGLRQEYQAERAIAALKRLAVPLVRVRRGGHVHDVAATELVPGDIVLLEAGSFVPADGRLLEAAAFQVQEAALTGESSAVPKDATAILPAETPLAERVNMAFAGTIATYGRATLLVTATGMATELGHIARLVQSAGSEPTPLERRLNDLGIRLAVVALSLVALMMLVGYARGVTSEPRGWRTLFMTAVSLAVAAVPEGLSAVVTIALALGAQRMLARQALIRKLPAVESLGSVTVICSDKTGTLTKNQMTVTALDVDGATVTVEERGTGADARYELRWGEVLELNEHPTLALLLAGTALCNDAVVEHEPTPADAHGERVVGDPTEGALVLAGHRLGLDKHYWEALWPRFDERPFDSERKRMTTLHRGQAEASSDHERLRKLLPADLWQPNEPIGFTKGALDSLLDVSDSAWVNNRRTPLDAALRARILAAHDALAQRGMRVLGVAFATGEAALAGEKNLTLIGLIGLIDPPRAEARAAIATCRQAGIRVIMITGDHPLTAAAIAAQLGISHAGGVTTGAQLNALDEQGLRACAARCDIYARVSPEHKLRLVAALQAEGQIVAMTGDGVNDAPALKQADVGVAMGITGTDVSKEAADMVLRDDNFSTIVAAVEEGRAIFDNVHKFIRYLLCSNASEIWVMVGGPLLGLPLPLLPLQILWMNLATDGLPALALGVEPAEKDIMRRPPRPAQAGILSGSVGADVLWVGLWMAIVTLAVGWFAWRSDPTASGKWQTMTFTSLTCSQLALSLAMRSPRHSLWSLGLFTNRALLAGTGLMFAAQLAVIYWPALQRIFKTQPLSPGELAMCVAASSLVFAGVELQKWFRRAARSGSPPLL